MRPPLLDEHLGLSPARTGPRREFLLGLAGLGAAALAPSAASAPQAKIAAPVRPRRIDTHHHFTVPSMRAAITKVAQQALLTWTPLVSLDDMDKAGVDTAILSVGDPGVWFGDDAAARAVSRECNHFAAKAVQDYPGRFGMFITLPLPDVDGALKEIEYGYDQLKADGVCLLSSYQGKYLGNPAFAPVMDELNRRKAVVFCHPFCDPCASQPSLHDGQDRMVEFVVDTTRTIVSVLSNGTAKRCPNIRFIWSHGGGTIPYITGRLPGAGRGSQQQELISELQNFYYDTAQAFSAYTMPSFRKLIPASHMLFGTDFPLGNGSALPVVEGLMKNGGFSAAEMRAVDRDNAVELFPRFRS